MLVAPIPLDEAARLAALHRELLLDSEPEPDFDQITTMVAHALDVPIALISLVDKDRQWFKSRVGLDATETSRDASFCAHAVASGEALIVADTLNDDRFADNPLVCGDPSIRFYAGVPLRSSDGYVIGTLCAIDREPRSLSAEDLDLLTRLAECVQKFLYLRRNLMDVQEDQDVLLRLVAMAFHDLRNPMTSVSAGIFLLQTGEQSVAGQELISDMVLAMEDMQRILLDTLDVALSTARSLPTHMRQVDLDEVLQQTAHALRPTLQLRGQTLDISVPEDLEPMVLDPMLIRRAVSNLLVNASKFAVADSIIALACERTPSGIVISVEDKGVGMSASDRETAFELFSTGDSKAAGHGLGLAFCKLAAQAHRGEVRAGPRRDLEPGSRLMIELPHSAAA